MPDKLTFSLTRAGDKVRIDYAYENLTDTVVQVHESALVQVKSDHWTHEKSPTWRRSGDTMVVTIGLPAPEGVAPPRGDYVTAKPGETVRDSLEVPMLSADWKAATSVALRLEVIDGEPKRFTLPTDRGARDVPDGPNIRVVAAADALPLPR